MSENYQVLLPGLPGFGLGGPSQLVQVCSHLAFSKKLKAIGVNFKGGGFAVTREASRG